ncbi:MAG: polymer-forming cytoskeletal protein [bacterium]|nr:polymer-forming cytoskeletal protein [bacterium]MCP5071493.1 polymer-forming cytoskeletal protein [bacterium]
MGFGRGRDEDGISEAPAPRAGSSKPEAGLTAFIDQGSAFEGKLSFKDTVRIDGSFRGQIKSENTLVVGETGEIDANIESQIVIVSGQVIGDVVATRKIVLHKTAEVEGNLESPTVVIEDGASFNGQLTMKADGKSAPRPVVDSPSS